MLRMKIKMIDLLVTIANGEKVPKKIKFMNSIWEYCKDGTIQDYINNYDKCLMEFIAINKDGLNDEVEIIEESKMIEKLELESGKIDDKEFLAKYITHNRYKINELIDEINNLKENK
jgi:hypothetical protein